MLNWYVTSVKFTKEFPDGTLKRITEPHLINAESFSDAEARIYEEVGEFIRGEFIVTKIERAFYVDIFEYSDANLWWMVKVSFVSEDADSGFETLVTNQCLVSAPDAKLAIARVEDSYKEQFSTFTIPELKLTKLVAIHGQITPDEREARKQAKLLEDQEIEDKM